MSRAISRVRNMRRWQLAVLASMGAMIVLGAGASVVGRGKAEGTDPGLLGEVVRGPLTVTVTESGEIEAERRKIIANELRWPVIIQDLVPEGSVVEKGDTIVQFECKELLDEIEQQELNVTSQKAKFTQSSENLKLKRDEMANNVLKARRALDDAKDQRDQYNLHDYRIEYSQKDSAVKIAEQNLALSQEKLDFKERVNKMPDLEAPFSANDIKADQLEVQRLTNNLDQARMELEKLQKFEHDRMLRQLDEEVADAELALKRAEVEANNQLLIATADNEADKRTLEMRQSRLDELRADEQKLVVKAEQSGLVVYDTGDRGRYGGNDIIVAKGESIQPRQQIMLIPDMSTLQIKTKVYEAIIKQVTAGKKAFIKLDARPGELPTGKVSKVAPLPDSQNRWMTPGVKVYSVTVQFDKQYPELKPGMTADVEIVLATLDDVLSAPIAAVFTEEGRTVCYRPGGQRVDVQVGMMNDRRVQIVSGLNADERVLLARPAGMTPLQGTTRPAEEGAGTDEPGQDAGQGPIEPQGPREDVRPAQELPDGAPAPGMRGADGAGGERPAGQGGERAGGRRRGQRPPGAGQEGAEGGGGGGRPGQ